MLVIFFCFVGFVRCDFASDSAECSDQLIGLTNCLTFIEGSVKKAKPECCSNLKQVLDKSRKCLCVLVKDRNEPGLGFKVNATLAMKLPGACNAPVNISECVGKKYIHSYIWTHSLIVEYYHERLSGALRIFVWGGTDDSHNVIFFVILSFWRDSLRKTLLLERFS